MDQWLTNYQFTVYIGNGTYGFSKISGMVQEMEYDCIQEGGRNWSPVFFCKPKSKQGVLVLEKGVKAAAPANGAKLIEVGSKLEGVIIAIGTGAGKSSSLKYTFDTGIVAKLELGDLDASGNQILIRKVEIVHTGLRRLNGE